MANQTTKQTEVYPSRYDLYFYLLVVFFGTLYLLQILNIIDLNPYLFETLLISSLGITFLFLFLGLIGPQWIRRAMQKLTIWADKYPGFNGYWLNPYEPVEKSLQRVEEATSSSFAKLLFQVIGVVIAGGILFFALWLVLL